MINLNVSTNTLLNIKWVQFFFPETQWLVEFDSSNIRFTNSEVKEFAKYSQTVLEGQRGH